METTIFEVELLDGRTWRVYCANKNQKMRFVRTIPKMQDELKEIREITNGIHNISDWEKNVDLIKN